MLKILQASLQQYVTRELPDVQAGFRKGRGTRDQIVNIHWIIKNAGIKISGTNIKNGKSRLLGEISITSDRLMIPPLRRKKKD